MEIDCDSHLGRIDFDSGEVWKNIPITEWLKLMEIVLPRIITNTYYEDDYKGTISKKRYEAGKIYYKNICKVFRVEDTSDESN